MCIFLAIVLSLIIAEAPPLPEVQPNDEEQEQEQEQQPKPETRSFLEVITGMMMTTNDGNNSRPIPPEMQWNVCVLLEKIVEAAKGGKLDSWNVGDIQG